MNSADTIQRSESPPRNARLYVSLVDRYHARIHDYLCWLCRDASLAEDLTAETFVRLWEHPPALGRGTERPYVFKVALNEYRQHLRRRGIDSVPWDGSGEIVSDPDGEPAAVVEREELRRQIRAAVMALPEIHRAVVLLHGLEDLTLTEVAQALDIPVGTAKSRLSAAYGMLKRVLRQSKEVGDEVR